MNRCAKYPVMLLCFAMLSCRTGEPGDSPAHEKAEVLVRDFGAIPDDGKCDRNAIRSAIAEAADRGVPLVFEEGVYDLFVDDASSANAIEIRNIDGFTLRGAVNEYGEPSTAFVRHYTMADNIDAKKILLVENCSNFVIENIRFDNSPQYMASGRVYYNDGNNVGVELFKGIDVPSVSTVYCCNLWNLETKDLKHVESVTYGDDIVAEKDRHKAVVTSGNKVMISSPKVAAAACPGDGISWHFGYLGVQTEFRFCDNLRLSNIESNSAIGFHIQTSYCRNIKADRVKIRRNGNQLAAGSRDGWKLFLCSGSAEISDMYCDGVRWDGQNVHGKFLFAVDRLSDYSMTFTYHGDALENISPGDKMGFWEDRSNETLLTVAGYSCNPGSADRICTVTFVEQIPSWIKSGAFCNVYSHIVKYVLENSEFRNIAGCASIIRNDNTTVRNNRYYNIMYPAVLVGGDLYNEGVTSKNARIEGNTIENSAWVARRTEKAAIDINVDRDKYEWAPYLRNITVRNNTIIDCPVGINATGVYGLVVEGNSFSSCGTQIKTSDIITDTD